MKIVVNTGGQDHRWLGNGYFKEHGMVHASSPAAVRSRTTRQEAGIS